MLSFKFVQDNQLNGLVRTFLLIKTNQYFRTTELQTYFINVLGEMIYSDTVHAKTVRHFLAKTKMLSLRAEVQIPRAHIEAG